MVKLEKILCFLFTLLVVFMVSQHCSIEGLRISPFDNCIDDPDWFTTDKNGMEHRCSDIGTTASCYDINNTSGQEGWERCLKSCGNCAEGKVTNSQQDNLAFYSGDPVEDYGMVLFTDDERKWVGLDTNETGEDDVRNTITTDESESILDIYDRLSSMEGLYDMLLGSVSSCLDCEQYDMAECINHSESCVVTDGVCGPIIPTGSPEKFTSCNASELSCDYTVTQVVDSSTEDTMDAEDTEATTDSTTSSIEEVSGEDVIHTYVKHQCTNGGCSLMFPTVSFNCSQIPEPQSVVGNLPEIVYAPVELDTRQCITKSYLASENPNIVGPLNPERQCVTTTTTEIVNDDNLLTLPIPSDTTQDISIPEENQEGFSWVGTTLVDDPQSISVSGTSVTIEPITESENPEVCSLENPILVESVNTTDNTFRLLDTVTYETLNVTDLAGNCQVTQNPSTTEEVSTEIEPNCVQLTANEVLDTNSNDISRRSCGDVCNSMNDTVQYISVDGDKCYCYKQLPTDDNIFIAPSTENDEGNSITECPSTGGNASLEILDEGRSLQMSSVPIVGVDADRQTRDMCKSYFLLDTSLTGQDVQATPDQASTTQSGTSDGGMSQRISLYDVCPRQCRAQGCSLSN